MGDRGLIKKRVMHEHVIASFTSHVGSPASLLAPAQRFANTGDIFEQRVVDLGRLLSITRWVAYARQGLIDIFMIVSALTQSLELLNYIFLYPQIKRSSASR